MSPGFYIPSVTQLMLVNGTSPWGRLIQRLTQSPYSHVCFAYEGRTYEMDFGGFYSREIEKYAWAYDLYDIEGMDEQKSRLLKRWCLLHRKSPYDYGKVIGMGLELMSHATGWRSILDSKRAMSCAEYVCNGLTVVSNPLVGCGQETATPALIGRDPLLRFVQSVPAYVKKKAA